MKSAIRFFAAIPALGLAASCFAAPQCEEVIYRVLNQTSKDVTSGLMVSPNPQGAKPVEMLAPGASSISNVKLTMNSGAGHANMHLMVAPAGGKGGRTHCHVMFPYFGDGSDSSICGGNGVFIPKVDFKITESAKGHLRCEGEVVPYFTE